MAACGGKEASPKPVPAKQAAADKFDKTAEATPDVKADAKTDAKTDAKAVRADPAPTKSQDGKAAQPDRGERFMDPPWFRRTLFAEHDNVDFKRSQVDDQGFFSSQFLFDLKEGTDVGACVKNLEDKVGAHVKDLKQEEAEGRVTIKGTTDRYRVVMMCGEAKGVMKAYVSYQWTS